MYFQDQDMHSFSQQLILSAYGGRHCLGACNQDPFGFCPGQLTFPGQEGRSETAGAQGAFEEMKQSSSCSECVCLVLASQTSFSCLWQDELAKDSQSSFKIIRQRDGAENTSHGGPGPGSLVPCPH